MEKNLATYHYTECGLDNVFIEDMNIVEDHNGEETVTIPAIGALHKVICEGIVRLKSKMTGQELRFLRSEMGMTQAKLAQIVKVSPLTVSRWERDENSLDDAAEMLIRIMAMQTLGLSLDVNVEQVSANVSQTPRSQPIRINAANSSNYELLAA
jgi:DNA-binding transcriptional regulator YiaG